MKKFLLFLMFAMFCIPWAANAQEELTVCDGTATNSYVPAYMGYFDDFTRSQFVIPADSLEEMNGGTISSIKFYTNSSNIPYTSVSTVDVYLMEVDYTTMTALEPKASGTIVYQGTLAIVAEGGGGSLTIEFSTPYTYEGGNLLVGVENTTDAGYKFIYFYGQTVTGASLAGYNSSSLGNVTGSQRNFIPKTTFTYTPGNVTCAKPELESPNISAYGCNIGIIGGSGTFNVEYKVSTDTGWTVFATAEELSMIALEGLTPATTYQVRIQSVCGEDPETGEPVVSSWKSTSFTTPCAALNSYPWGTNLDNFTGSTSGGTNNLPMCWNYINTSTNSTYKGYPIVYNSSTYAHSGTNSLRFYSYTTTASSSTYDPQDQYAILPEMEELNGKILSLSARGYNANSTFKVGLMSDPTDVNTFQEIANQEGLTTSYQDFNYILEGGGNYVAIMIEAANAERTSNGVYIDDISIITCPKPTALTATNITTNSAMLGWTAGSEDNWTIYYKKTADTSYTSINVSENPYTLGGLDAGSTYVYYVKANCSASDVSYPSSTFTFTTAFTIPLIEPFDTTTIPNGWTRYSGLLSEVMEGTALTTTTSGWTFVDAANGVFDIHTRVNIYGTSCKYWLVTPVLQMEDNVELGFDLALTKFSGTLEPIDAALGQDDQFVVLITTNGGETWEILRQWNNTGSEYVYNNITCSATGEYVTINLSQYAGQNVAIAFYGESTVTETGSDNNLHIDNVSINYIPSCNKPTDLAAVADVHSAELSWTANSGESAWTVYYKKTTDEEYMEANVESNPFVLEGLDASSFYHYYVVANCSSTDESEASSVFPFVTGCEAVSSYPWTENFDSHTGVTVGITNNLPVCWNYINTCTYSSYKGYPVIYNASGYSNSGNNHLRFYTYTYGTSTTYDPQDQYAILPEMDGLNGKQLTLFARGANTNSSFKVGMMTDPTDVSTFVEIATTTPTTSYVEYTYMLEGEGNYVAIMVEAANTSATTRTVYIDDIMVADPPTCVKPQGLAVSDVTNHTATLTWVDSLATAWQISFVQGEEETIIDVDENPYTLTGLDASTAYTVKVRSNCGNGDLSYWSTAKNFTTAVACPVPTLLTATELTGHTAKLGWKENGQATEWVVRYKISADTVYTYINVYDTTVVTINDLMPSTGYTFNVQAVCGGIDGESDWSTAKTFTTTVECPAPTNLICEGTTTTTATLSWFGGEDDMWEVLILQGSDTVASYIVELAPYYVVENLQPGTTYSFKVRTYCGETWSSAKTFTTAFGIPFVEPFATTSIPTGWTRYSGLLSDVMNGTALTSITSSWMFTTGNGISDTHARLNIYGTGCKYWLVTPPVLMDENVQLTFDMALTVYSSSSSASPAAGSQADDKFAVLITTNGGTSWEVLRQWDNAGSEYVYDEIPNTLTEMTFDLSNYANSEYIAIAFYGESTVTGGDNNMHIDNVKINYIPTCYKPTGLTVSEVTANTATLSWESDGQAWDIYLEENGDELNGGIQVTENPYILTNLTPASTYLVKVRTDCSSDNNGWSDWSNPVSFNTACEAVTEFPWTDDFEEYSTGNFTAVCWQNEHIEGTGTQIFKIMAGSAYSTGDNTTKVLQLPDMTAGTMTKLVLPFMTLPGDNYQFSLDVYRSASTYNENYPSEGIRVFASTNGEIEGATELAFIPRQYQVSNDVIGAEDSVGWYTYQLPIGISGNCYIILRGESQYCTSTYMDNFVVEEMPVTTDEQTIALSAGTNWVSFNVETNLDDLKAALVATNNTAITIQGQSQNATYNPGNGRWIGQLRALDLSQMYKIKVADACEITLEGTPVDPSMYSITIAPGVNYIAYPFNTNMTVANAFAGFGVNGDVVQSQLQNATYNGSRWIGQLRNLEPGKGYIYKSASTETRVFNYPTSR